MFCGCLMPCVHVDGQESEAGGDEKEAPFRSVHLWTPKRAGLQHLLSRLITYRNVWYAADAPIRPARCNLRLIGCLHGALGLTSTLLEAPSDQARWERPNRPFSWSQAISVRASAMRRMSCCSLRRWRELKITVGEIRSPSAECLSIQPTSKSKTVISPSGAVAMAGAFCPEAKASSQATSTEVLSSTATSTSTSPMTSTATSTAKAAVSSHLDLAPVRTSDLTPSSDLRSGYGFAAYLRVHRLIVYSVHTSDLFNI